MDEKKPIRLPLPLYMHNPLHKAAYEKLQSIPKGKRTEFICQRIIADEGKLPQNVYQAISECMERVLDKRGSPPVQALISEQTNTEQADEAGEVKHNFLGFLSGLQEGDDGP